MLWQKVIQGMPHGCAPFVARIPVTATGCYRQRSPSKPTSPRSGRSRRREKPNHSHKKRRQEEIPPLSIFSSSVSRTPEIFPRYLPWICGRFPADLITQVTANGNPMVICSPLVEVSTGIPEGIFHHPMPCPSENPHIQWVLYSGVVIWTGRGR